jgi:hypothetical protein
MQTMNQSLARLVERRLISRDLALNTSSNKDELNQMLERGAVPPPAALAGQSGAIKRPLQGVGR